MYKIININSLFVTVKIKALWRKKKKKEITDKESELSEKIGLQELQKKLQMKNNSIDL